MIFYWITDVSNVPATRATIFLTPIAALGNQFAAYNIEILLKDLEVSTNG